MLKERYFSPKKINNSIKKLPESIDKDIIGKSVQNKPIYLLRIGSGPKNILIWSQMHGNETTTTKALFEFIPWLTSKENLRICNNFTFYIIPQLNPDGAELYTRNNFNDIDLNRDGANISQPESKCLINIYNSINPFFCFNLHGQRPIYSVGKSSKSSTISFLAPSIDISNGVNNAREKSMLLIVSLFNKLSDDISGHISRYKDDYNPNCIGDFFSTNNTPTVLIEAGHYPNDYKREITKKYIFDSLRYSTLFLYSEEYLNNSLDNYFKIPENEEKFVDIIFSGVTILSRGEKFINQMVAFQYKETLINNGKINFTPHFVSFGSKLHYNAHKKIDLSNKKNNFIQFKINFPLQNKELNDLLIIK